MTDSIPRLWNHWSLVSCHYCPVFTGTILRWPCPGKNVSRLRLCTDMCRGLGITGHSESCPGPGSRVSEHCEGPGNTGALSRHRLPPGISSAISRLSLRPPRSRAVNEDLFMFGMDSSRNGPKNSDGNFIVVWDNINNPDILLWPEMWHVSYWRRNTVKTNPKNI